jgi:hypothetical protein
MDLTDSESPLDDSNDMFDELDDNVFMTCQLHDESASNQMSSHGQAASSSTATTSGPSDQVCANDQTVAERDRRQKGALGPTNKAAAAEKLSQVRMCPTHQSAFTFTLYSLV